MSDKNTNIIYLELKDGIVKIKMRPDLAPNHVNRIKKLVKKEFYRFIELLKGLWLKQVILQEMEQEGLVNH